MRRCGAAQFAACDRDLHPVGAASPKARVNGSFGAGKLAPDERQIAAVQPAVVPVALELGGETVVSVVGFCNDEQPGRILVQTMYDPWPLDAANA